MWWSPDNSGRKGRNRRLGRRETSVLAVRARARTAGGESAHRALAVGALLATLAALGWLSLRGAEGLRRALFSENDHFLLRRLDIRTDGHLPPHLLREYAEVAEGMNLFTLDPDEVRRRLLRAPIIREARVRRELPDTLRLTVEERTPLAQWRSPEMDLSLAVDAEGYITGTSHHAPGLPYLTGITDTGLKPGARIGDPNAAAGLEVIRLCDANRWGALIRLAAVRVDRPDRLELTLAGRETVFLPREQLEVKLRALAGILKAIRDQRRQAEEVDLRPDQNFTVKYRDGAG